MFLVLFLIWHCMWCHHVCSGHWYNYFLKPGQSVRASAQSIFPWCLWFLACYALFETVREIIKFYSFETAPNLVKPFWQLFTNFERHSDMFVTARLLLIRTALKVEHHAALLIKNQTRIRILLRLRLVRIGVYKESFTTKC